MKRKIVTIDEEKCTGCGLCIAACHEGALQLVDGKAKLVTDSYCDGLGACLPACPADAIHIIEREAGAFDEAAVAAARLAASPAPPSPLPCGCPGTMAKTLARKPAPEPAAADTAAVTESRLANWPVQIKLVPVHAPYLQHAALLIAADCTAFAFPDIHRRFMANKVTLIGCPKLDSGDYAEKLTALFQANDLRSVTVLRMEVPCCGGIVEAVKRALAASGKVIPWRVVTFATDGTLLEDE